MSGSEHNGGGPTTEALTELRKQAEELTRRIDALAATKAPSLQQQPRLSVLANQPRQQQQQASDVEPDDDDAPTEVAKEAPRRGVRLADLPSPVAQRSPWRRLGFWLIVLALVAAAFVAGYFWTDLEERIRNELGAAPATTEITADLAGSLADDEIAPAPAAIPATEPGTEDAT